MIKCNWKDLKEFVDSRSISIQFIDLNGNYYLQAIDKFFGLECILNKELNTEEVQDFEENYKANGNKKLDLSVDVLTIPESQPFAAPTFRIKRNASSEIKEINQGDSLDIDFVLTAERYLNGGKIIVKNNDMGDYFTAKVIDPYGIIPEDKRSEFCENYPIVSEFVEKEWVDLSGRHEINTQPIAAKLLPGLVLRVTYHAASTFSEAKRYVGINYYLSKKLN